MPLCTILTKCPAPPSPTQSQQGISPWRPTFAQMLWKMGLTYSHAAFEPPGIIAGPFSAPSSPPETPVPMNSSPLLSTYAARLAVSGKWLFPPSMMISPGSKTASNFSIYSSTGLPALTISITFRGTERLACKSSNVRQPMMFLPAALPLTKLSTFSTVRLYTATVKPLDSMFIARFSPITASPIKPISACFMLSIPFNHLLNNLIVAHGHCPCKYPKPAFHPQVLRNRLGKTPRARPSPNRTSATCPASIPIRCRIICRP